MKKQNELFYVLLLLSEIIPREPLANQILFV
jgi:hypothetical protein